MALSYLTLFVALCLSCVAAFYSIVGLTAIFAAAVIPIVIMGSILEIAKLVVTVWLHEYWHECRKTMKAYLVPAVAALMLITSMGIFGFLSKAHMDQGVPTGDIAAKVALYDEKIATQKENIKAARANLSQLDAAVNETMGRSTNEQGADKAVAIRRSQAKDRAKLMSEIDQAQNTITKLQEERAPIAAEYRKVEAEVGPVKYIAALIYDDTADQNVLEKAVRWVIILLVAVFDPLAVMMLLAATESLKWERAKREVEPEHTVWDDIKTVSEDFFPDDRREDDELERAREANLAAAAVEKEPETEVFVEAEPDNELERAREANALAAEVEKEPETEVYIEPEPRVPEVPDTLPGDLTSPKHFGLDFVEPITEVKPQEQLVEQEQEPVVEEYNLERPGDYITPAEEPVVEPTPVVVDEELAEKEARRFWKFLNPTDTIKHQEAQFAMSKIDQLPWNTEEFRKLFKASTETSFLGHGNQFPLHPNKGDTFIRTDSLPTNLYKWNGDRWIIVDKESTDVYAYDDNYIKYLVEKINSGEYDTDLLSDAERDQIETYLLNNT